jgi:hypothetical protein
MPATHLAMDHRVFPLHDSSSSAPPVHASSVASRLSADVPSFLTLPPEVRSLIYQHVFKITQILAHPRRATSPVLHVRRQLKTEEIGIIYISSIFDLHDLHSGVAWLVRLRPEFREVISEVRYDCSDDHSHPPTLLSEPLSAIRAFWTLKKTLHCPTSIQSSDLPIFQSSSTLRIASPTSRRSSSFILPLTTHSRLRMTGRRQMASTCPSTQTLSISFHRRNCCELCWL